MLKIGQVLLSTKNEGKPLYFFWYSTDSLYERIDVIDNIDNYDVLNTSNCVAALYRSSKEKVFGDNEIISNIYKIKLEASYLHVQEEKNISVEDGVLYMTTHKKSMDGSIEYMVKLKNGKLLQEYYRTPIGVVQIDEIKDGSTDISLFQPMNLQEYKNVSILVNDDKDVKVKAISAKYRSYDEILRKYPELVHILDNDYVVIESYEQAEERLNAWITSKERYKCYDIESSGTSWGNDSDTRITGVFLGYGETWSTYFPFRQDNFEYNLPLEFLERIFNAINDQPPFPEVILLGHNMKFEIQGFYKEFKKLVRFDIDTYLLAVLVNPLIVKGSHTLKALTAKYEGKFYISLEQIFYGKVEFNILPPEIVKIYGCPDATSPVKIYKHLIQELPKDETYVMNLEMQLPYVKGVMNEYYGLRLDQKRLMTLIEDEEYKVELLKNKFMQIHHVSGNINSYDVLKEIIYDKLRCKVLVYTDKGLPSTSKIAISKIVDDGTIKIDENTPIPMDIKDRNGKAIITGKELASNKYPSLVIYQAYKKCTKELSSLKRLKTHSEGEFFKFYINQVGAGTNRQTSDAHQFSNTMKSCVIADSPYHQLVSCDWKQVELRILAGMAGQEDLLKLEEDPSVDIHRAILSIIQGKPMYMISDEERKAGKSVNFGVVYMMSEYGLARKDFGPGYTTEQLNIEKKKISDFYNGLPMIKKFVNDNGVFLRKNGYIKTAFHYYRYFKELLDPTTSNKKAASMIRAGNNTPVQGTGAQMMKIVELKVWNYIRERGWDKEKDYDGKMLPMVRLMLPIHDEILLSYDKSIPMEEIITMFKECMELDIKGFPPFFAAPAFIDNWYDGKESAYEVDIEFRDEVVEKYKDGIMLLSGRDYLKTLNDYRKGNLKSYMDGLIRKYKTPEEVAKHVTHDSLTHELIDSYIPGKEKKKFTHTERIAEAVKRYMNDFSMDNVIAFSDDRVEDKTEYMDLDMWTQSYAHVDQYGNIIEDEVEPEEGTDDIVDDVLPEALRITTKCNVVYLMSECLVDLTGYDISTTGEKIHQQIMKLADDKEYYRLIYVIGENTIFTGKHIGFLEKEINEIFSNVISKEE